jgi:hypothetical protein
MMSDRSGSLRSALIVSVDVGTEMSLNVLAYNLTRVLRILGFKKTMKAMRLAGG